MKRCQREAPPIAAGLVLLTMLGWTTPAAACSCLKQSREDAVHASDAVFEGRVVESTADASGIRVTLDVVQYWKGVTQERVTLRTQANTAACGYPFAMEETYLVYASGTPDALTVSLCSRTQAIEGAQEDVAALGIGSVAVEPKPLAKKDTSTQQLPPGSSGCAGCAVGGSSTAPVSALMGVFWIVARRRSRRRSRHDAVHYARGD